MKINKTIILFLVILISILVLFFLLKTFLPKYPAFVPEAESVVQKYGIPGGMLVSFVGSLWFVLFPYEIILAPLIKFYNPAFMAVLAFAFGATLADLVNFYTGKKFGKLWIEKKIEKKKLDKVRKFLDKWGIPALFLFGFLGPVTSYDIVAFVMGGFSDLKMKLFAGITILCRIIHFSIVWLIADLLFKASGIPI